MPCEKETVGALSASKSMGGLPVADSGCGVVLKLYPGEPVDSDKPHSCTGNMEVCECILTHEALPKGIESADGGFHRLIPMEYLCG